MFERRVPAQGKSAGCPDRHVPPEGPRPLRRLRHWSRQTRTRRPTCCGDSTILELWVAGLIPRRHVNNNYPGPAPMVIRRFVCLSLALCLAAPAPAAEVAGVTLADRVSVGGQALVLNGAGIGIKLFFKIYVGSLYLPRKAGDLAGVLARGPRRIQMNLLRDLTSAQLVGALVGGLNDNNSPAEMRAVKAATDQLVRILTDAKDADAKEDDVLTLDFVDGATKVALNGEARGVIPGAEFNSALTRIWLGDKPAEGNLKKAMLGG
jgi:hypothetical protein